MNTISVSLIGVSGYTGLETLRLLLRHPHITIHQLMGYSSAGKNICDLYGHLQGICDLNITAIDIQKASQSDLVIIALPHGKSQEIMPELVGKTKIIDLSGDFRIRDKDVFEKYYQTLHQCHDIQKQFTYGLPEIYRPEIEKNSAIANPGCFANNAQLALYPLRDMIREVSITAITGSSGSGRSPSASTHHPTRNSNMRSYKIGHHQHLPEIMQSCQLQADQITFIPTSGPFVRGIHMTSIISPVKTMHASSLKEIYQKTYQHCPFVRIKDQVQLIDVVGSNYCDISIHQVHNNIVIQSALDNLIKGAAGTALQNINLMFGFDQTTGLKHIPSYL